MSPATSCKIVFVVLLVCLAFRTSDAGSLRPDHSLFTQVLQTYVKNGVVNYKGIKADSTFPKYISYLSSMNPREIDPRDTLAFWINVYNAFTIKVICDHYPVKSITDLNSGSLTISFLLKSTIWDDELVNINGKKYTLNFVENKIVRPAGDARVHFAMVCAAKSCPPLRSEAYEGDKLSDQFDDQGRIFMSLPDRNIFDIPKKRLQLSKIYDWFEDDFEKDSGSVIKFISRFVPADLAAQLKANEDDFDIDHLEYNWDLNE